MSRIFYVTSSFHATSAHAHDVLSTHAHDVLSTHAQINDCADCIALLNARRHWTGSFPRPIMSVCGSDSDDKTVHIFLGYFFIVNYCLGTGFLGVPFSFFYSGYLAAIPTLIATAFFTWVTSLWLLEIMARAQVSVVFFK